MPKIEIKMNGKGNYEIRINNDFIILSFEELVLLQGLIDQEVNSNG